MSEPQNPTNEDLGAQISRWTNLINGQLIGDAMAAGVAGVKFVSPEAESQAKEILRRDLRVPEDATRADEVRATDGTPAKEYVAAQLRSSRFAHCVRAVHPHGGTAHPDGNPGSLVPSQFRQDEPQVEPRNLGELMLARGRQAHEAQQGRLASGRPSSDMSLPFGLGPRR